MLDILHWKALLLRLLADQLQTAAERGEFGEAAHLVEAVQQLSAHFQGYASIPKVAELSGRLQALQASLQVYFRMQIAVQHLHLYP